MTRTRGKRYKNNDNEELAKIIPESRKIYEEGND